MAGSLPIWRVKTAAIKRERPDRNLQSGRRQSQASDRFDAVLLRHSADYFFLLLDVVVFEVEVFAEEITLALLVLSSEPKAGPAKVLAGGCGAESTFCVELSHALANPPS